MKDVTLKEYFNVKFKALDKALKISTTQLEKRLEGMNEFRAQLKDQAGRFVTRDELNVHLEKFTAGIRRLELKRAELQGKASQTGLIVTMIISSAGLIIGAIGLLK